MAKNTTGGITRRTFLTRTAAGAGALAMSGGVLAEGKVAQPKSSAQPEKYSWETAPAPIREIAIGQKVTSDIVIIGAGISGITASLSAIEAGSKTIVLEKYKTWNSRGNDNAAINSKLQQKLGIQLDKDEVILELMKYGGNKIDQRLLRLWADNSGPIMDWMMEMTQAAGYETTITQWPLPAGYDAKSEYYREFPVAHRFKNQQPGLMKVLVKNAIKKGVDIRYNTRVVQLVRQGKGRVSGVIAQDKDGKYVLYNATKAVILCTGDYGHDSEMMDKYCSWAADVAKTANVYSPAVNTGDGHKMAMWIGGVMEAGPHAPVDHTAGGPLGVDAFLHVNTLGERYENEDVPSQSLANSMLSQPGQMFWQVFDSKWADDVSKMGVGLLKYEKSGEGGIFSIPGSEGWATGGGTPVAGAGGGAPGNAPPAGGGTPSAVAGAPGGNAPGDGAPGGGAPPTGKRAQADTIEELASKMGVPVETFKATVARYNELAKLGKDLDFGKRADRLTTIEKPPFFAGASAIGFLVAVGGLIVNPKLQLLDAKRNVIPGIYLAGNTVGRRFANDYPTMCAGLSHGFAWTTGYLAGKHAAEEIPS